MWTLKPKCGAFKEPQLLNQAGSLTLIIPLDLTEPKKVDKNYKPIGKPLIAADAIRQANRGEIIFYVTSRDAPQAFDIDEIPVDAAIVAIVDTVSED